MDEMISTEYTNRESNAAKWRLFTARLRGMFTLRDHVQDGVEFGKVLVDMFHDDVELSARLSDPQANPMYGEIVSWSLREENPRIAALMGISSTVLKNVAAENFYPEQENDTEAQAAAWEQFEGKFREIEEIIDQTNVLLYEQERAIYADSVEINDENTLSVTAYEIVPDDTNLFGTRDKAYMEIMWLDGATVPRVRYFD